MSVRRLGFVLTCLFLYQTITTAETYVLVIMDQPQNVEIQFGFAKRRIEGLKISSPATLTCIAKLDSNRLHAYQVTSVNGSTFDGSTDLQSLLMSTLSVERSDDHSSRELTFTIRIYSLDSAVHLDVSYLKSTAFITTHDPVTGANDGVFISIPPIESSDVNTLPEVDGFTAVESEPNFDYHRMARLVRYPKVAQRTGLAGTVLVAALVGTNGIVERTKVVESVHHLFEDAAVAAVVLTPFTPAISNGKPVRIWVRVPIKFKLR